MDCSNSDQPAVEGVPSRPSGDRPLPAGQTAPDVAAPPPMAPGRKRAQARLTWGLWISTLGAVLALLGFFLPWTLVGSSAGGSRWVLASGHDLARGIGVAGGFHNAPITYPGHPLLWFALAALGLTLVLSLLSWLRILPRLWGLVPQMVLVLVTLAVAVATWMDYHSDYQVHAHSGIGLVALGVGSAVVVGGALLDLLTVRGARSPEAPPRAPVSAAPGCWVTGTVSAAGVSALLGAAMIVAGYALFYEPNAWINFEAAAAGFGGLVLIVLAIVGLAVTLIACLVGGSLAARLDRD